MKNQNEEIDEMIRRALSKEEASYYDNLKEQSLFESIFELYKGKQKWFNVITFIMSLIFNGLAIYCLIQFLEVENTNALIRWSVGLMFCLMVASMLKLWAWNQMDKKAIMREIKRLQLLVADKH